MQNIGLAGLGFIGKTHLNAYQYINSCRVKAIWTLDNEKGEKAAADFGTSFVKSFDHLLKDESIDVIDICLPTYLHEEYIIKAAKAGKHIICEKPLTLTPESARNIIKEVGENGVELFVGHVLRFWPEYELIKSYTQDTYLNDVEIIHAKRLGQFPAWSQWFQDPGKSGGALFDLHIHDIDFIYYLLGKANSVYAVGKQNKYGAWDHIMTTLSYDNNGKAFVEASHRMPKDYPFTMEFRAQALQGTLEFKTSAGANIEKVDEGSHQMTYYTHEGKTSLKVVEADPFQQELTYFIGCLENKKENKIIPLGDVLYVLTLMKAIETSLDTGRVIKV